MFFVEQKTAYEVRLSLVGSEMCVRDRPVPAIPGGGLAEEGGPKRAAGEAPPAAGGVPTPAAMP